MNSGQITFSTVTCQIVALLVGVYKVVVEARRAGCFVVTGAVCAFDQATLRGDQTENEKAEDMAVAALLSQTNPPAAVVADSRLGADFSQHSHRFSALQAALFTVACSVATVVNQLAQCHKQIVTIVASVMIVAYCSRLCCLFAITCYQTMMSSINFWMPNV